MDIGQVDVAALRARRDALREVEARLSYRRRILQAQLDILGRDGDVAAPLQDRLAAALADAQPAGDAPARAVALQPPVDVDVEPLPDLASLDDDDVVALAERLAGAEREVSDERRGVLDELDEIQAELVRRYRDLGGVDVDAVVSGA